MELADFYPTPAELIGNEVETVKFFTQNAHIQEHSEFYTESLKVVGQASSYTKGFSFSSHFDLHHKWMPGSKKRRELDKPNVRIIIAALVEQENDLRFGNISYALVICRLQSKRNSILRKFHFDVTASSESRQPHPLSHLQYCGEMIDIMKSLGYRDSQLKQFHTKVREPRIFVPPTSLALLVDMALREFADPDLRIKFLRSPEWQNVVRSNEELILKRFHEKCCEVISRNVRSRPTLLDEFYRD